MPEVFSWSTVKQFFGYGMVGVLNTALSFAIINALMFMTGITSGPVFLGMSFATFCAVIVHSFVWNKYLIFAKETDTTLRHREYVLFFMVSGGAALVVTGILHFFVDVIGAPAGISAHVWANVALAVAVVVSVLINFSGYKFLVFRRHD